MKDSTLQFYKERLARVLVYIQQQLDEPLSLEELAERAHISPFHFHHVFTGMVGETPMGHIRRLRLERAAARLKHGRRSVVEIALEAGYETHEAFSRAFKIAFSASPSQFRRSQAICPLPTAPSGIHYLNGQPLRHFKTNRIGDPAMKVTLQNLPALRVACVRHTGSYDQCGKAWDRLMAVLGPAGFLAGARFLGVCYDDPEVTPPDKIRYDACVTVDDDFAPSGDIGILIIPGGEYAVTTHFGPYQNLGQTYRRLLGQWLPRSGRELRSSPCFEEYFNSPENTAPEDLLTDIHAPLEPLTFAKGRTV